MRPKQYNNTYKVQTSTGAEDGNISNSLNKPGPYLFVRTTKFEENLIFGPNRVIGSYITLPNQIKRMKKMIIFIGFVLFFLQHILLPR